MKQFVRRTTAAALFAAPLAAFAGGPHDAQIQSVVENDVKRWLQDPVVIEAIRAQNGKHGALSQAEIESMDTRWRAETSQSDRPFIEQVLTNALSEHLRRVKDSGAGLYTEIFVMDNRGLNVGQSDVTSDYWQGDEAKWKNTYLGGPNALFIDEVEFDESTQQYQVQTSVSITDPTSNEVIGAVTIGMNVEMLDQ